MDGTVISVSWKSCLLDLEAIDDLFSFAASFGVLLSFETYIPVPNFLTGLPLGQ